MLKEVFIYWWEIKYYINNSCIIYIKIRQKKFFCLELQDCCILAFLPSELKQIYVFLLHFLRYIMFPIWTPRFSAGVLNFLHGDLQFEKLTFSMTNGTSSISCCPNRHFFLNLRNAQHFFFERIWVGDLCLEQISISTKNIRQWYHVLFSRPSNSWQKYGLCFL